MKATRKRVTKPRASKPTPKKTIISLLLDETGSMDSIKADTIGGFNDYVKTLQATPEAPYLYLTLTTFDSNHFTPRFVAKPIKDVPLLTDATYRPGASTPLYDAIGKTAQATQAWKDKEGDAAVLFVIQTDGEENASHEFKLPAIKQLIQDKTKAGWTFVYLGAGMEAWGNAAAMGVSHANTLNYAHTGAAHRMSTSSLAHATAQYSAGGSRQTQTFFTDHTQAPSVAPVQVPDPANGGWADSDPFKTQGGAS